MKEFIRNNKPLVGIGGLAGLAIVAFLAFGVFGIHTAFIDNEVSEAGPVFASGATADQTVSTAPAAEDDAVGADGATEEPEGDTEAEAPTPAESEPVVRTVASGAFQDSAIHAGSGDVNVITDGNQTFLRFEDNFATDNGPDLNVYLRNPDNPDDYIDLGDLKGNIGSQNYELPEGTDLSVYSEIDIWCVRFGVSFADALLTVA